MPELPEVETIRRDLSKHIKGHKIVKADVYIRKVLKNTTPCFVRKYLVGQEILKLHRKGKSLVIETTDFYLAFHLRMEGKFVLDKPRQNKYTSISLKLDNDLSLKFDDHRMFATFYLYNKNTTKLKDIDD